MRVRCGYEGSPQARKQLAYYGATIWVSVGLDPTWTRDQPRAPNPDKSNIQALIDTGAQESCIDSDLVASLGFPIVNKRSVCGVGSMEVDVCLAQVHIELLRYTIEGEFASIPLIKNGVRESIILGRSFLRDCKLIYDGKAGDVTIELNL